MNPNSSFARKVIYACGIVALLFPLFWLGQPPTKSADQSAAGGILAQKRAEYGLSQAELGEIDPASETMKMATLGLRGVATTILWTKANEYKRKETWDKLSATLNQLSKLQPNFISVWEFQAHNLSYNVSAEFDNYEQRYHWVKRGIEFLLEGTRHNMRSPRLYWNLGWFSGQKIGRADEYRQFRQMFRNDFDFHTLMSDDINIDENARGIDGRPDNWLVGYLWYLKSQQVESQGVPITWLRQNPEVEGITDKRRSAVIFYSDTAMSRINYADQITEENTPGEATREAWRKAGIELEAFGNREIPTSYAFTIRLNDLQSTMEQAKRLREQLDEISPGLREKLREEREETLTPEEIAAMAVEEPARSEEEWMLVAEAQRKTTVSDLDVADNLPAADKVKGRRLATRAGELDELAQAMITYRGVVNYGYWTTRCEVEQKATTADARRYMLQAEQKAEEGNPEGAREDFEKAWDLWAEVFNEYKQLRGDTMAEDLEESILRYKLVLEQLDEDFPVDFKLNILLEAQQAPPFDPTIDNRDPSAPPIE